MRAAKQQRVERAARHRGGEWRGRRSGVEKFGLKAATGMSGALLELGEPVLELLPEDCSIAELRSALVFASLVWNRAVLFESDHPRDLELAERILWEIERAADGAGLAREVVDSLVVGLGERKRERFPLDRRLVAHIDARGEDGRIEVHAASVLA
jgi:hypothetical protein